MSVVTVTSPELASKIESDNMMLIGFLNERECELHECGRIIYA